MKSLLLIAFLSLTIATGFAASSACSAEEANWQQKALDYRMSYLTDKLDLTPAQQTKLRPILQKEIANEADLHRATRHKIETVLTPEQKAELEELTKAHHH